MIIPVLAAPTASGKTALALELAEHFKLEILSADAMLVYRGMDIGTAKPTPEERTRVIHHLLDVRNPDENFSVADYVRLAESAIADSISRKQVPLLVGGTGFYVKALAQGLPTVPEADKSRQEALWERFRQEGLEPLHKELEAFSPQDALRAQKNPRRVIRALEIIRYTGRAPSSFAYSQPAYRYSTMTLLPALDRLRPRIEARTRHMLEQGWVEEVRELIRLYPSLATAGQALGYDLIAAHIRGELSLADAEKQINQTTLNYAKRQLTWFRKQAGSQKLAKLAHEAKAEIATWLEAMLKAGM